MMLNAIGNLIFKPNVGIRKYSGAHDAGMKGNTYKVSKLEKFALVWNGKYKSIADVPEFVNPESVERARSWARVRISNYTMVLTAIACVVMIYSGKRAHQRGDSLHQQNLDWHKQHQEKQDAK